MSKKNNELTEEQLAILYDGFPTVENNSRPQLPRLGMLSKDLTEETKVNGKKKIEVLQPAGTFYTEKDLGEVNEDGKKVWTKEYLGEEIDVIIAFHRRQLRLYDKSLNKFISSPIYDTKDQIIPLYLDKRQVAKGNQEELQNKYPAVSEKGKKISKLKEEKILYILFKGELYQSNLTQSSKYSFLDYSKKVNPSTVVTTISSFEETNGSNTYRKMTFKIKRVIDSVEFDLVMDTQSELKEQVRSDAKYFLENANTVPQLSKADKEFDEIAADDVKFD